MSEPKEMQIRKTIMVVLGCFFCVACGYHLRGTGSSLPPHVQNINIPIFKNKTTRFQLDVKLTQSVIDEMVARGKVEITSDVSSADATLQGEIIAFNVYPIAFSGEATADRYRIEIVANIVLWDRVNNRNIFSNPNFVYQQEYEVQEGTDFETVETEAIDKVALRFARSLVITMLEGF